MSYPPDYSDEPSCWCERCRNPRCPRLAEGVTRGLVLGGLVGLFAGVAVTLILVLVGV